MRRFYLTLLLFLPLALVAQTVPVWKLAQLEKALQPAGDTVKVVNFWASWCGPCVAELPAFIAEADARKGQKVKFYFVTLDFKKDLETKVKPFVKRKNLPGTVALLDEIDYNAWIPGISKEWEGNIPATLFVQGDRRVFKGSELSRAQLGTQIDALIPTP